MSHNWEQPDYFLEDVARIEHPEPPSPDEIQQTSASDTAWNAIVSILDDRYMQREHIPLLNREHFRKAIDAYIAAKTQELLAKLLK